MKTRIIIFIILIGVINIIAYLYNQGVDNETEDYLNNFDLNFGGTVYEKDSIQQDGGIVRVDVKKSNKDFHDMRDKTNYYFCILKNGKAELIVSFMSKFRINDSIYVDGAKKKVYIYRDENLADSIGIKKLMMRGRILHYQTRRRHKL